MLPPASATTLSSSDVISRNRHIDITSSICGWTVTRTAGGGAERRNREKAELRRAIDHDDIVVVRNAAAIASSIRVKKMFLRSFDARTRAVSCSNSISSRLLGTRSRLVK